MHALVIGAGPAGSLAATLLARRGIAVTLIERHRFPRHKVCGECISALGREVLRRHGLEHALVAVGVRLLRTRLHSGETSITINLPRPMLGLSRAVFDQILLTAAIDAGVVVLQPARVESIESLEFAAGVSAVVRRTECNVVETLAADVAVFANGTVAFTAEKPAATGDLGIKTHFVNVRCDPAAISLFAAAGSYGGLAPIENGRWNAAFSVPAAHLKVSGGDVAAVFDSVRRASPALAEALAGAERIEPWLAAPLPRYAPRRDWPAHCVPAGNAAAAIEPIGGEGMGLALRSAELAAEAILTGTTRRLPAAYDRLWTARRFGCRAAARVVSSDRFGASALELLHSGPLADIALAVIGKA